MTRFIVVLVVIALFLLLPTLTCAAELITQDPNVSGAVSIQEPAQDVWADPRLDQKITYQARHKQVRLILDELSTQTGVTLKSGYSNMDWQVRDRRMTISVKDLPLRELMESIARVMSFKWSVSDSGGVACYRLYMDRRALLQAQSQYKRQMAAYLKEMEKRRREFIDGLMGMNELSPEQLADLEETDPQLYAFARNYAGQKVAGLIRALPQVQAALRSGDPVSMQARDMPPAAQAILTDFVQGYMDGKEGFYGSALYLDMLKKDPEDKTLRTSIRVNDRLDKNSAVPEYGAILGIINIDCDSGISLYDAHLGVTSPDLSTENTWPRSWYPFGDPVVVHDNAPELDSNIDFAINAPQVQNNYLKCFKTPDYLLGLAKASGCSVVADSFYTQIPDVSIKAWSVNAFSDRFRYNWWKRDAVIEFRSRDWFKLRSRQIPDAWLDRWFTYLEKEGFLDIDYMAQISSLTSEQFMNNVYIDERIPGCPHCYLADCWIVDNPTLSFYWVLTNGQRRMLFTDEGFDISELTPYQRSLFEKMITSRYQNHPEYLQNPGAVLRLTCVKNGKEPKPNKWGGISVTYDFTLTTSDNLPPLQWTVYSPKYYQQGDPPGDKGH